MVPLGNVIIARTRSRGTDAKLDSEIPVEWEEEEISMLISRAAQQCGAPS